MRRGVREGWEGGGGVIGRKEGGVGGMRGGGKKGRGG